MFRKNYTFKSSLLAMALTCVIALAISAPCFAQTAANQLITLSANGKFLVNSTVSPAAPVYITGEDGFALATQLCIADVQKYLTDRANRGYNLVWFAAVDNAYSTAPPANCNGTSPFSGADFTNFNSTYWSYIDTVVAEASKRGITLLFNVAFTGVNNSQGWFNDFNGSVSGANWTAYGAFLGNRYKTANNIIWLLGGDSDIPNNATVKTNIGLLGTAIAATDPNHLLTFEGCRSCTGSPGSLSSISAYASSPPSWLKLNASYDQQANITGANGCPLTYSQSSTILPFEIEAWYEIDNGRTLTGAQLRQEGYWSTLTGCYLGFLFGNGQIWPFSSTNPNTGNPSTPNWTTQLPSPGSVGEQYLGQLMRTREHWLMVPDASHTYLTAGFGSGTTLSVLSRSSDGQTMIAYLSDGNATAKTINMTGVSSASSLVKSWWYNPQTGAAPTLIGTFANTGTRNFTAPDSNDWVLVLDDASATNLCPPGISAPWCNVIDPSRATDWRTSGLPAIYQDGEVTANPWTPPTGRTQFGSLYTCVGTSADVAAINAAFASAPAKSFVPVTGTCSIPTDLILRTNYVTLRGIGGPMAATLNLTGASTKLQYGVCCTGAGSGFLSATSYPVNTTTMTLNGVAGAAPVIGNIAHINQCDTGLSFCATVTTTGTTTVTATTGQSFTAAMVGQTMTLVNTIPTPNTLITFTVATFVSPTVVTLGAAPPALTNTSAYVGTVADGWPAGATPDFVVGRDNFPFNQNGIGAPSGTPNGPKNFQQQNVLLTNVVFNGGTSYTVTFTPGLTLNSWSSNNDAQMTWQAVANTSFGVGVEGFTIKCQFNQSEKWEFGNSYGSWQKGNRIICGSQSTFNQIGSAHNVMLNGYTFAEDPVNSLSQISEPTAFFNSSDTLIMNNILTGGLCLWGEGGRTRDVFAYNYCRDAQSPDYQVIIEDHGVSDQMDLTEGLMVCKIQHDWTHGTHDFDTDFRDYLCGGDDPYWSTNAVSFQIDWYNRFVNLIGNSIFGRGGAYTSTGPGSGAVFSLGNPTTGGTDALLIPSLFRWGNTSNVTQGTDTPANSGLRFVTSEVPVTLTGNAAQFQNALPANHNLPCSLYLPVGATPCVPLTHGGTGLSWWKVCTNYPTCSTFTTPVFPSVGPENIGGLYLNGTVYDNPAAVAWKTLPIDTFYQQSYTVTASSWSNNPAVCGPLTSGAASGNNPCMILTVTVGASAEHLMGGFQLTGAAPGCYPASGPSFTGRADNEILITASNPTQVAYSLASDPGANACVSTFKFPDVRQFDERIYQLDTGAPAGPIVPASAPTMFMTSNEHSDPVKGNIQ